VISGGVVRFFEPRPEFVETLTRLTEKLKLVYDVGAGAGQVAKALHDAGHAVIAIDLYRHEHSVFPCIIADGTTCSYLPESVVIVCRPCHNGFSEDVFRQALKRHCRCFYVGFEKNLENDLGDLKRARVARDVGEDAEDMWEVTDG